jgi:hypothetical protein
MAEQPFNQEYLDRVQERIRWNKRAADRTMGQFIFVRLGLVLVSAALPALTTIPNRIWATVAAVLVAVLTGLDTQFQWGEEWRHFRTTQLALERAKSDFDKRRSEGERSAKAREQNFGLFYNEVQDLLQRDIDQFFKFRITQWKRQAGQ